MSIRRKSDPSMTQRIWDTIKITVHQRSLPNNDRMVRHLARVYGFTEQEAQDELNKAAEDGLVLLKKVPARGGIEQESYRLPPVDLLATADNHDWYCCKCQRAGAVEGCEQCHRVYHPDCYPSAAKSKICIFCEKISNDTYPDKTELNHILSFTCGHLKAKLPPEITNRTIVFNNGPIVTPANGFSGPTWVSEGEDAWRPGILIKKHMDLAIMDAKTSNKEYKNLAEFEADAHNILHNIMIYHGAAQSVIGDMGQSMYQDCCYDLQEIRRCADCYRISNEKSGKMWFCIPCNPPHQLVYAKQKGYPYWPAKVMQVNGNVYDVRFFGGHHMRANIEKVFIRPISSTLQSLQIKRSTAWNRAFEELKHHQHLLAKIGKKKEKINTAENDNNDDDGPTPAKIRNQESSSSKGASHSSNPPKQLMKDLRVKVERLSSEGHDTQTANDAADNKDNASKSNDANEDRQVPHLPVAEDEPAREITSTCPQGLKKEGSQEDMVTSSCQEPRSKCVLVQTEQVQADGLPPAKIKRERRTSEQPTTTALEKLRRELELDKCKELERLQAEYRKELRQMEQKHKQAISDIKKKQWCYNCENEAIYHCCWNTAYCSTDCQQIHWQREHKRVCRRKR